MTERPRSARARPTLRRATQRGGRSALGGILAPSPTRTTVAVALIGSTALVGWGLVARDATQIPLLVAGLVVYGTVFTALALGGAVATVRSAASGEAGRSFVLALLGGTAAIVAAASLGGAIVLALMWGGAS